MSKSKDDVRPRPPIVSQAPSPITRTEGGITGPHYYKSPTKLEVAYAADLPLWSDRCTTCFILGIKPESHDEIARFEPSYLERFQRNMEMIKLAVRAGELEFHGREDSVLYFEPRKIVEWVGRKQSIEVSKKWVDLAAAVAEQPLESEKDEQNAANGVAPPITRTENPPDVTLRAPGDPTDGLNELSAELYSVIRDLKNDKRSRGPKEVLRELGRRKNESAYKGVVQFVDVSPVNDQAVVVRWGSDHPSDVSYNAFRKRVSRIKKRLQSS